MAEYIEREVAKAAFDGIPPYIGMTGECVQAVLAELPAADVVPVVRCKDCLSCEAHFKRNGEVYFYRCNYFDIEIEPLDFCSCGERKGGDE